MNGEGLALDFASHRYTYDGERVGGVSEILTSLGIVETKWFSEWAASRGTAVHLAVELHLHGRLDWLTVDPRIEPYVRAAVAFLRDAEVPAISPDTFIERPVWHSRLRFAGMPDLIARAFGRRSVIDWKSGAIGAAGLATAGYESAHRDMRGEKGALRRLAVSLRDDGTYKMTELNRPQDYTDWAAACLIFNTYVLPRKAKEFAHDRAA